MKCLYQRYDGLITKYEQLDEHIRGGNCYIDTSTNMLVDKNEVLLLGEISENILELIEKDDYVNGYKVISVDYDVVNPHIDCIELDLNNNYQYNFISINQIKSIVTKEQFESVKYEI